MVHTTSVDHFKNEESHKNIFLLYKIIQLRRKKSGPVFVWLKKMAAITVGKLVCPVLEWFARLDCFI
jgi:hypothetical protein